MLRGFPAARIGADFGDQLQCTVGANAVDLAEVGAAGQAMQGRAQFYARFMHARLGTGFGRRQRLRAGRTGVGQAAELAYDGPVDTGGGGLNALKQRRPGAALGASGLAGSWGRAMVLHTGFLHSGIGGSFQAQGCDGIGTLLNGITTGVSPMTLSQHPLDHAQEEARGTNAEGGRGPRKLSASLLYSNARSVSAMSCRGSPRNLLRMTDGKALYLLSEQNTYREPGIDYFDRYRAEQLERTPPRRSRKIFRTATSSLNCGCHRSMRPEKGAHVTQRQRNPVLGLLPRVEAHLSVRREKHRLHGHRVGVRRDIVRENQYGCLASAHEIARHGEDEVGVRAVHFIQEGADHRHRDFGPAGAQRWAPAGDVVVIEEVGHFRTKPAGLHQHGGNDTLGRPQQQVPDEGTADAEAHHHELPDAQVINQTKLVIGVCLPRAVDLQWAGGLATVGIA
jgi:hypothetical protein